MHHHRPALETKATLRVVATHDGFSAEATATIHIAEINRESALGIPEPKLVSDADGRWRSRMRDQRWEVNDAHADYIAIHSDHRSRVRYLVTLLAKEIAAQNSGHPEQMKFLSPWLKCSPTPSAISAASRRRDLACANALHHRGLATGFASRNAPNSHSTSNRCETVVFENPTTLLAKVIRENDLRHQQHIGTLRTQPPDTVFLMSNKKGQLELTTL